MNTLTHTEDCTGTAQGDDCAPTAGDWNQPPGHYVREAEDQLEEGSPWCRVQERAWEIADREGMGEA